MLGSRLDLDPRRGASRHSLLALAGAAALVVVLVLIAGPGRERETLVPAAPRPAAEREQGAPGPFSPAAQKEPTGPARREASAPVAPGAPKPPEVRCLSARDRSLLAGVRVFAAGRPVTDPSDDEGRLSLFGLEAVTGRLTVWREGFAPLTRDAADPWPTELLFEPADATLEVEVPGVGADWRVMRSQLRIRGSGAGETFPWSPRLREISPGFLLARGIPATTYDLYLWLRDPDGKPHALSRTEIEVPPGKALRIELDLAGEAPEDDD